MWLWIAVFKYTLPSDLRFWKGDYVFLDVEILDFKCVVPDEVSAFFDVAAH